MWTAVIYCHSGFDIAIVDRVTSQRILTGNTQCRKPSARAGSSSDPCNELGLLHCVSAAQCIESTAIDSGPVYTCAAALMGRCLLMTGVSDEINDFFKKWLFPFCKSVKAEACKRLMRYQQLINPLTEWYNFFCDYIYVHIYILHVIVHSLLTFYTMNMTRWTVRAIAGM